MFAEGIRGGWGQGWFAWRPLALTMPRDRAIIFRDPVGKLDDSAQFRIESVRRTRRVLSSREFWHDRAPRRLYRLSGADATRRERRQFVGDKDPELSGLRARRRGSSPDKRRDLPGRLPRMDSSDLTTARFYPDYVSTKKCPLILLRPQWRVAHRRPGEALRPCRLQCVRRCGARLFDGVRCGSSRPIDQRCGAVPSAKSPALACPSTHADLHN